MPIITLTTDWNLNDYYVGAIKGKIYSKCANVNVVDITHQIQTFNIAQAAFILKNSYCNFPEGTIHIICVNSEPNSKQYPLVIEENKHFFIGTDNGIFGLIFKDRTEKIIKMEWDAENQFSSFAEISVFANAACHLANEGKINDLGTELDHYQKRVLIRAAIEESVINGSVIYIDSYQNAITNISYDLFKRIGKNRPFEIFVQSNHYKINKINKTYQETSVGEILALFNSLGLLEIAINNGNVAELLNLNTNSCIRIKFYDIH